MLWKLRGDSGTKNISESFIVSVIVPRVCIQDIVVIPPEPLAVVIDFILHKEAMEIPCHVFPDLGLDGFSPPSLKFVCFD